MTTTDLILLIVEGGGAGVLTWWLIEDWIQGLQKKWRRPVAFSIAILLSWAAVWAGVLVVGVLPVPQSTQELSDLMVNTAFLAVSTSQLLHSSLSAG